MTKQEIIAKLQMASTLLAEVRYYGQLEDEESVKVLDVILDVQKLEDYFEETLN
jgi:hypothetical protein